MKPRKLLITAGLSLCLLGTQAVAGQPDDRLLQAQTHLQNNDAAAAYALLLPLEEELAGQHSYDLLFGQAALRSGHKVHAAMAFERCIAVTPASGDCRLGMAQAHMLLNEKQGAEKELRTIERHAPPPQVAKVVREYLDLLESGQTPTITDTSRLQVWLDVSFGYDDNVNAGPRSRTISLPTGYVFSSSKDETGFAKSELGLSYQTSINDNWHLIGGANVETTNNFSTDDNSFFKSILQGGGYAGMRGYFDRQRVDLIAQGQNYQLRGHTYRNLYGAMAQYSYLAAPDTLLSTFFQHSRLHYRMGQFDDPKLNNVNSNVIGANMVKSLLDNRVVAHGGFYLGKDSKAKSAAPEHMASDYFGVRTGATWFFHDKWQTGFNLLFEQREYGQENTILFAGYREDDLLNAQLNLRYQATPKLSLHSKYSHTHNNSNSAMRDYKRNILSLGVRYDFF